MAYSEKEIEQKFQEIIHKIAFEGKAIRNILKLENMPAPKTFYKWLNEDGEKVKQYARASEIRADYLFDQILDIADATENDVVCNKEGEDVINHHVINRDRLRVDARKWYLSKINPKKYSDKMQVDNSEFREQPLFGNEL